MKSYTLILSAILSLPFSVNAEALSCVSPDGEKRIEFSINDGVPQYSVLYRDKLIVGKSKLGLALERDPFGTVEVTGEARDTVKKTWKPVLGYLESVREEYNSLLVKLQETTHSSKRQLHIEFRAYNEGVAFRYVLPEQKVLNGASVDDEYTEFRFAEDFGAYPIVSVEGIYGETPKKLSVTGKALLPLTVDLSEKGVASVFQAHVHNQPPVYLKRSEHLAMQLAFRSGKLTLQTPQELSWHGIMLAPNATELVKARTIVENLNPPCQIEDPSWIQPGKFMRENFSTEFTTKGVKESMDHCAKNGVEYLHIDWSWYGTEKKWSPEGIADFEEHMPDSVRDRFLDSSWKNNVTGNPMTVAKGWVPYLEKRRKFYSYNKYIDLDISEIVRHGNECGVGLSLYINGATIKPYGDHDMEDIFRAYAEWGVKSIKPGFVACNSQADIEWFRKLVRTAAKHKLSVCIHDRYIADGMRRTWPNILTQEGGAGMEHNPPVSHELMLPFTRALAGSHDFTPALYKGVSEETRTKLYQLARVLVYQSARQSIRTSGRNFTQFSPELEFLKKVPTVWHDEEILVADPGKQIVVARRNGKSWFVGGMNDETPRKTKLSLDFLSEDVQYKAIIFSDVKESREAKRTVKDVTSKDTLTVEMNATGGCALIIEEK